MDYNETLKYISSVPKFSKNLGNADLKKLLKYLNNPQDSLKFIHIAGTNGKGSTAAMIAKILESAGFKTGLYISPFINVFNERIQINGEYIPDCDLIKAAETVKTAIEELQIEISEFAQITAMAFLYFAKEKCDYVVLETGLGGMLDATNVIKTPKVCIITKIGLDHTKYLGDTIEKIAIEKCGIIKKGVPVVTSKNQELRALSVIKKTCTMQNAKLVISENVEYDLSLAGDYQRENAANAVNAARILNIPESAIRYGLLHTLFPARFEYLSDNLIIDGAHNPDGAAALVKSLRLLQKPITIVTAMMEDKDCKEVCSLFAKVAEKVIVTELEMPRCISAEKLAKLYQNCDIELNPITAVNKALSDDNILCVCGSLYLAAEIRKHFKDNR